MRSLTNISLIICVLIFSSFSAELKKIVIDSIYNHDKFNTQPKDIVKIFRAYITSFDSEDDNNGDGKGDIWGIPEWVSYEIKKLPAPGKSPNRPREWIYDKELYAKEICPKDYTYRYSKEFRKAHPNWYNRGHMCMKLIGWRLGANADWNTHTMLNACPQRYNLNAGIWLDLEYKTIRWADKYGSVWVICGPIIENKKPKKFLGEKERNEMLIAIPDKFFKIVIKENNGNIDVLAFIFSQDTPKKSCKYDYSLYFASVDEIEKLTGLDFLTTLSDSIQAELEKEKATKLWGVE